MSSPTPPRPPTERDKAQAEQTVGRSDESSSANLGGPDEPRFAPPARAGEMGTFGRYRVLQKIGAGGMGAVYQGHDAALDRKIALKVMLPQYAASNPARERFLREARSAAKIKSDHVVTIFDVGEERGVPFIAMEYLFGMPLDQFLKTKGELPLAQVLRIARETALGLAAAHELGLVHRDIKPANIWLEAPKGRVKILDFGLARSEDDAGLTRTGAVMGTPAYMSPEQGRGLKLDGRSDLFSLGIVLYRLCTGKRPFTGNTSMAVLASLAADDPVPPRQLNPHLPEALEALVLRLLAKNPAERCQTAQEVVDAITAIENPLSVSASGSMPAVVPLSLAPGEPTQNVWEGLAESGSVSLPSVSAAEASAEVAPAPPKSRGKAPQWPLFLAAGLLIVTLAGLAVALALARPARGTLVVLDADPDVALVITKNGQVIHERTTERTFTLEPGSYAIEFADPRPGQKLDPDRVDVSKGGTARVRVVGEKPRTVLPLSAPDRRAIDYTFSVGGVVRVQGDARAYKSAADLPKEAFLYSVAFEKHNWADDARLSVFQKSQSLIGFAAPGSNISDAGVSYLKDCAALKSINLRDAKLVGDTGLLGLRNCKNLEFADLANLSRVTSSGLAHLKPCTNLAYLDISGTGVGDTGLVHLENLTNLTELYMRGTKVTEPPVRKLAEKLPRCRIEWNGGVIESSYTEQKAAEAVFALGGWVRANSASEEIRSAADLPKEPFALTEVHLYKNPKYSDDKLAIFRHCKTLTRLHVASAPMSDAGLGHFRNCTELRHLNLAGTEVGDTGLAAFKEHKNLTTLDVQRTHVTPRMIEEFAAALPKCRIVHDGGTVEPKK